MVGAIGLVIYAFATSGEAVSDDAGNWAKAAGVGIALFFVLVGVNLDAAPGSMTLTIHGTTASGGAATTQVPLWATNLFGSAFYIFLLRQFFLGLPRDLFEAAKIDGVGHFVFERNVPATFGHPWYSFLGDLALCRDMLTGRIKF